MHQQQVNDKSKTRADDATKKESNCISPDYLATRELGQLIKAPLISHKLMNSHNIYVWLLVLQQKLCFCQSPCKFVAWNACSVNESLCNHSRASLAHRSAGSEPQSASNFHFFLPEN